MKMNGYFKDNLLYSRFFQQELGDLFTLREFSKGDHLFSQGDICRYLYYIKKGIVRVYYYSSKGKEITLWFAAVSSPKNSTV